MIRQSMGVHFLMLIRSISVHKAFAINKTKKQQMKNARTISANGGFGIVSPSVIDAKRLRLVSKSIKPFAHVAPKSKDDIVTISEMIRASPHDLSNLSRQMAE